MAAKYNFATGDVIQIFDAIKREYHPRLRDSIIIVLWREDVDFGMITDAKVVPPDMRFLINADAIVYVHKIMWTEKLNENQKAYHMDEALEKLYARDKIMDDGRPQLGTQQPIKIGFADVIKRHGAVTEDVKALNNAFQHSQQLDFFGLMMGDTAADRGRTTQTYGGLRVEDRTALLEEVSDDLFLRAARAVLDRDKVTPLQIQADVRVDYRMALMLQALLEKREFIGPAVGMPFREVIGTHDMLIFYEEQAAGHADGEEDDPIPFVSAEDEAAAAEGAVN
jgi:hypothetical protein